MATGITDVGGIQGTIGKITSGTSILNAFLVAIQKVDFDVKPDNSAEAFLFAYRGNDGIELNSDITDHYTESNSAIQDQIALKPEVITLEGFIGELSDQTQGLAEKIKQIASQLTALQPYVPQLVASAQVAFNQAQSIYNSLQSAANSVIKAYDMIVGNDFQTKQQKAFAYFYDQWKSRSLFTVQTPWAMFDNMAIMSLKANQDGETSEISDFTITFKKIRFAETTILPTTQGRLSALTSSVVNQGTQKPTSTLGMGSLLDGSSVPQSLFTGR